MGKGNHRPLPLGPLLGAYRVGIVTPTAARPPAAWLTPTCLDTADDHTLAAALADFYAAVHPTPFPPPAGDGRRVRFVRHALNHLLRGQDPLPERLGRCATPGESYHIPGL